MIKQQRELRRAIERGNLAAVERCLRRGADPNVPDGKGIPPLFRAAFRAEAEITATLIRFGANPRALGPFGRDALGYSLDYRFLGSTPERLAATVAILLDHGVPADTPPSPGRASAFWSAVVRYPAIVVQTMLDRGVDPNRPLTDQGFTPVMAAAINRNCAVVELLLAAGADPQATTTTGWTAARMIDSETSEEAGEWSADATAAVLDLLSATQESSSEAAGQEDT
jgi:ankyrin repeat protein